MQNAPAFTGTGPHGHRSRMRTRLLANPAALADYEIIEMLLFLGIPRRDTKPQAKGLVMQFGGLAEPLGAPPAELLRTGLPEAVVDAFGLVRETTERLAHAGPAQRRRLGDWASLEDYLDPPRRAREKPGLGVLLLDSKNQLLEEASWPLDLDWPSLQRDILCQALARHAGALVVVRSAGSAPPSLRKEDRAQHAALVSAAGALSILVHDWMVIGAGEWVSLRKADVR